MPDVTFRSGDPKVVYIKHLAASEIAVGQVVLLGNLTGVTCGIAARAIPNGTLGVLTLGGFWDGINLNNAAVGVKIFWDNSAKKFTTTSTNNAQWGFVVENGQGGANSTCRGEHFPYVPTGSV